MKKIILSLLLLIVITACNNQTKEEAPAFIEAVYNFRETFDAQFCNPDSILPGDCGFGEIYLTKKGNVVYYFYCMGQETETYNIGKYTITDSAIVCTFNKEYDYPSEGAGMPDSVETHVDPNSGKMTDTKSSTLSLIKLTCKTFDYCIKPTKEQELENLKELEDAKKGNYTIKQFRGYVLSKLNEKDTKSYIDALSKIKALSDL